MFTLVPEGFFYIDVISMVLFGVSIGVLISYLGGLMAIDIAPKRASGEVNVVEETKKRSDGKLHLTFFCTKTNLP